MVLIDLHFSDMLDLPVYLFSQALLFLIVLIKEYAIIRIIFHIFVFN